MRKSNQKSFHITAQRMVMIARLFFKQQSQGFAFIHKGAQVTLWLSQCKGAFQRGQGLGLIVLRLMCKRLR